MTAHELFPALICRGCGHDGLNYASAKTHLGSGRRYCRGGDKRSRDKECACCHEHFIDEKFRITTAGKERKIRVPWRGRRIYEHKIAHLAANDTTEEFA